MVPMPVRSDTPDDGSSALAPDRAGRLGELAESQLCNSQYAALRNITCEYDRGILILRGRLPTYYLKQIAQMVVAELDGVLVIANQIEVVQRTVAQGDGIDLGNNRASLIS